MRGRFVLVSAAVISLVAVALLVPSFALARELAHSRDLSEAQRLAAHLAPVVATGADATAAVVDVNAKGGDQVRVLLPDGSQIGHGRSAVPPRTLERVRREAQALEVRTDEGGVLLQPVPRGRQGMAIVEVTFRDGGMSRDVVTAWTALGAIAAVTVAFGVATTSRLAPHLARHRRRNSSPTRPAAPGRDRGIAQGPPMPQPQNRPQTRAPQGQAPRRRRQGPAHRRPKERKAGRYRYALAWTGVAVCGIVVAAQAFAGSLARGTREVGRRIAGPDTAGVVELSPSPLPTRGASKSPSGSPSPKRKRPPRRGPHVAAPAIPAKTPSPTPSRKRRRTPPRVTIDSPPEGTEVHGQAGVMLTGRATGLGRNRLRIFEFAPDGLYYVADEGPVPVHDGRWRFHNGTIGAGTQDVGKVFRTIAVIANTTCQKTLAAAVPNAEGNVAYRTLPTGCREGDSVRVLKVAP